MILGNDDAVLVGEDLCEVVFVEVGGADGAAGEKTALVGLGFEGLGAGDGGLGGEGKGQGAGGECGLVEEGAAGGHCGLSFPSVEPVSQPWCPKARHQGHPRLIQGLEFRTLFMSTSLYAEVAVQVHHEGVAVNKDGVDFEAVEGDFVAGGGGGVGEGLAEDVSGVDLHAGRHLVTEEGAEEEVELGAVRDFVEAGVAEADGFSFSVGGQGDDCGDGEGWESDAGSANGRSHAGVGFDADDDAVLGEGEMGVFNPGGAGRFRVASEVIASVGAGEKLLFERAFQGIAGYAHLDRPGGGCAGDGERS